MGENAMTITPRMRAYIFVTNPGDPGWVDPQATPEVQAQQLAIRKQRAKEWTDEQIRKERMMSDAS